LNLEPLLWNRNVKSWLKFHKFHRRAALHDLKTFPHFLFGIKSMHEGNTSSIVGWALIWCHFLVQLPRRKTKGVLALWNCFGGCGGRTKSQSDLNQNPHFFCWFVDIFLLNCNMGNFECFFSFLNWKKLGHLGYVWWNMYTSWRLTVSQLFKEENAVKIAGNHKLLNTYIYIYTHIHIHTYSISVSTYNPQHKHATSIPPSFQCVSSDGEVVSNINQLSGFKRSYILGQSDRQKRKSLKLLWPHFSRSALSLTVTEFLAHQSVSEVFLGCISAYC